MHVPFLLLATTSYFSNLYEPLIFVDEQCDARMYGFGCILFVFIGASNDWE
jgi:hypothetical protein